MQITQPTLYLYASHREIFYKNRNPPCEIMTLKNLNEDICRGASCESGTVISNKTL